MTEIALAILFVVLTVVPYFGVRLLQARTHSLILNPVLATTVFLILVLLTSGVDYGTYDLGGRFISFFLGPSVVALGVPLYLKRKTIIAHARAIIVAIVCGSIVGVVIAAGLASLLGATDAVVRALAPRSVTTPIAIGIAERIGGLEPLTATLVIASGVFGAVVGPPILRVMGVRSRAAYGLAMGAAAHGIGTARALEDGALEGAAAGLAIGLMGLATAVAVPVVIGLMVWLDLL
jgi:predicted murein hydrolase (TIGR00659 family)